MTTNTNTPARVGRERTCTQCGAIYRSPRNSSRYCTPACRKKANRGSAPSADPQGLTIITKALILLGYVGPIGPASSRSKDPPTQALLVPFEFALDELSFQFNRRGFGYVTREEFAEALRKDNVQGFSTRSPEATERNRFQARQRQRINRAT